MKIISFLRCPDESIRKKIAFVTSQQTYTYEDVRNRVAAMVEFLRLQNLKPRQRVLMISDHDEYAVFFFLAASVLGLQVLIPYNLQATAFAEWANIIKTARPDRVVYLKKTDTEISKLQVFCHNTSNFTVVDRAEIEKLSKTTLNIAFSNSQPIEKFLVLFTSGTTGNPKAICLREELIALRVIKVSATLKFHSDARVMMSGLMNNTTGIIFSLGSLAHNATLFFPESQDTTNWGMQIEKERITHIMLRPVFMKYFLDDSRTQTADLSSLQTVAYGAAPLPIKVLEKGRKLMNCDWIQGYGLSETFGPFCWLLEKEHQDKQYLEHVYCVGRPDNTLEVAIFDSSNNCLPNGQLGEVAVRGEAIMEGYYNFEKNSIESVGDWFYTGDLGMISPDGYLVLKGRSSESILTLNGHRIYPSEIENSLYQVPGIEDAALVGWSVDRSASVKHPVACIYTDTGLENLFELTNTVSELIQNTLSPEKWPTFLYVSPQPLPKSQNGKIVKRDILPLISPETVTKFPVNSR